MSVLPNEGYFVRGHTMRTKILPLLIAGCLLCVASWFVHMPPPTQADEVPEKYRDTVQKALEYLVKHQHNDGHWEGDDGKHPVAMTGLVGIALLMEKDNPPQRGIAPINVKAKYAEDIRKAVDWLISKSQPKRDGLIYADHASETSRYMQGHGFATLFLAGAFRDEPDEARRKKVAEVLTAAVKYIVKAQSSQGGWYDTSRVEGHDFDSILATVIQIQALQAAENVGVPAPSATMSDARAYLVSAMRKYSGEKKNAAQSGERQLETAAALAGRYRNEQLTRSRVMPKDELREQWLKYCQGGIPTGKDIKLGRDELSHYYYAQALFNVDVMAWDGYRTRVFDHLQANQNKDGSWPGSEGIGTGPVYATALWCTVMQLDKRSHPSRVDEAVDITLLRESHWDTWLAILPKLSRTRC
jgi:hypothetical protein